MPHPAHVPKGHIYSYDADSKKGSIRKKPNPKKQAALIGAGVGAQYGMHAGRVATSTLKHPVFVGGAAGAALGAGIGAGGHSAVHLFKRTVHSHTAKTLKTS